MNGESSSLDMVHILTGPLPLVIVLAAILAGFVSWVLLRLYRRSVILSMRQGNPVVGQPTLGEPLREPRRELAPLSLQWLDASSNIQPSPASDHAWLNSIRSIRLAALIQAAAGAAFAGIMIVPWMVKAGNGFSLGRLIWLLGCYGWPAVLAITFIAAVSLKQRVGIIAAYCVGVAALASWTHWRNPDVPLWQLVFFWGFANGPATALLAIFLNRRVRAAGPLVLAFMVTALSGVVVMMELARTSDAPVAVLAIIGDLLGLGARTLVFLWGAIGFLLFAVMAWPALRWIGRHYLTKRTSDDQLRLDAMWLLFTVLQSYTLVFEGLGWILTGPCAFAAYKVVSWLGFKWMFRGVDGNLPPTLLLLRVFALGKRSEALLEVLGRRWLRTGTVAMIAGPDLATTAVAPHELLAFLGGRLSREFVTDDADLSRRMAAMDRGRDPDARYRVTEFFCHAGTWQMAMGRLARDAEVVLMDLRSFSPANRGCLYELQQVLSTVSLENVLLLIDGKTDRGFLEQTLAQQWRKIPAGSLNRSVTEPTVKLFMLSDDVAPDFIPLIRLLFEIWKSKRACQRTSDPT